MTALVFIAIIIVWSVPATYFQAVASKEKAGPGRPWFGEFISMGWLSAPTPRGRRHATLAALWFFTGPILLFLWIALKS
jgi:hypothetical protein